MRVLDHLIKSDLSEEESYRIKQEIRSRFSNGGAISELEIDGMMTRYLGNHKNHYIDMLKHRLAASDHVSFHARSAEDAGDEPACPSAYYLRGLWMSQGMFVKRMTQLQESVMSSLDLPAQHHHNLKFPGSQPVSLDRKNLQLLRQRYYYATWKADGTRYMLFLTRDGCYLIDRNFRFRRVQLRFPTSVGSFFICVYPVNVSGNA
ncbi:hypothetical protein R1sor_019818 [Riccia sorocarpa]|uniref:mRNA capping enzyme adenylation domain-containing protein n=1 Tax=Riccia sorocarpa TaxID=122646 RepID=A0ABD3IE88_9MARC